MNSGIGAARWPMSFVVADQNLRLSGVVRFRRGCSLEPPDDDLSPPDKVDTAGIAAAAAIPPMLPPELSSPIDELSASDMSGYP